jgi:hypothetical protein
LILSLSVDFNWLDLLKGYGRATCGVWKRRKKKDFRAFMKNQTRYFKMKEKACKSLSMQTSQNNISRSYNQSFLKEIFVL